MKQKFLAKRNFCQQFLIKKKSEKKVAEKKVTEINNLNKKK